MQTLVPHFRLVLTTGLVAVLVGCASPSERANRQDVLQDRRASAQAVVTAHARMIEAGVPFTPDFIHGYADWHERHFRAQFATARNIQERNAAIDTYHKELDEMTSALYYSTGEVNRALTFVLFRCRRMESERLRDPPRRPAAIPDRYPTPDALESLARQLEVGAPLYPHIVTEHLQWNQRLLEAELALVPNNEQKNRLIDAHVVRLRELAQAIQDGLGETTLPVDVEAVRYYRASAELLRP